MKRTASLLRAVVPLFEMKPAVVGVPADGRDSVQPDGTPRHEQQIRRDAADRQSILIELNGIEWNHSNDSSRQMSPGDPTVVLFSSTSRRISLPQHISMF